MQPVLLANGATTDRETGFPWINIGIYWWLLASCSRRNRRVRISGRYILARADLSSCREVRKHMGALLTLFYELAYVNPYSFAGLCPPITGEYLPQCLIDAFLTPNR